MSTQPSLTSADTPPVQRAQDQFTLTRLIYSLCGAVVLYFVLWYGNAYWARAQVQKSPYSLNRTESWFYGFNGFFYASDIFFVLAALVVIVAYRPKSELFRWPSSTRPSAAGVFLSCFLGVGYGLGAFILAGPLFWLGDHRVTTLRFELGDLRSSATVMTLLVIVVFALFAEMVCRGIVLKTLADHVSKPAAILASGTLFAVIYPVLGFPTAIVLGIVSGILYERTRNLLAPITATIVFTVSGATLALYHILLHSGSRDTFFRIGR